MTLSSLVNFHWGSQYSWAISYCCRKKTFTVQSLGVCVKLFNGKSLFSNWVRFISFEQYYSFKKSVCFFFSPLFCSLVCGARLWAPFKTFTLVYTMWVAVVQVWLRCLVFVYFVNSDLSGIRAVYKTSLSPVCPTFFVFVFVKLREISRHLSLFLFLFVFRPLFLWQLQRL